MERGERETREGVGEKSGTKEYALYVGGLMSSGRTSKKFITYGSSEIFVGRRMSCYMCKEKSVKPIITVHSHTCGYGQLSCEKHTIM